MPTALLKTSPEPPEQVRSRKLKRLAILLEMASENLKLCEDEAAAMFVAIPPRLIKAHAEIRNHARKLREHAESALLPPNTQEEA